jgi:hypothetical protein
MYFTFSVIHRIPRSEHIYRYDYRLYDWGIGVHFPVEALRPTQSSIQRVQGSYSTGLKETGRLAHHSSPSSAEITNT